MNDDCRMEAVRRLNADKRWDLFDRRRVDDGAVAAIARELNILPATAFLLYMRGCHDAASAYKFINQTDKTDMSFHDPFLLADMDAAVERVARAVDCHEKTAVYGDYDVDGVTSVSALCMYLKSRGADVRYYIPTRSGEGYGVNKAAIKQLADEGVTLIVTVDTGVTACDEAVYARELGVDMVITDHHECHCTLPDAVAVVNPRRADSGFPFRELAGVGVVFKFICALENHFTGTDCTEALCESYADLVAIGTIADVMPLVDENRLIVSLGLRCIESHPRPGVVALLEKSGVADRNTKKRRIDSSLIGFVIAPRINAAGRISDASDAAELMMTDSQSKANAAAMRLCEINAERQAQEKSIADEAYEMIAAEHDFSRDKVIVLAHDNWNQGVIGIVASRITEKLNMPSILISFDGETGKGSGRSVRGMNLVDALSSCSDLLIKFGGHELAAGLSIERPKLETFKRAVNEYAAEQLDESDLVTTIDIDEELKAGDITMRFASELRRLEPFGVANQSPVFLMRGIKIAEINAIGGNKHTKMLLRAGNTSVQAVCFGSSPSELEIFAGDSADIVCTVSINDFMNTQSVQLIVKDIRLCEAERKSFECQRAIYGSIMDGSIEDGGGYMPERSDFAAVYNRLRQEASGQGKDIFLRAIKKGLPDNINLIKIKIILDIFSETNIITTSAVNDKAGLYNIKVNSVAGKVNLEQCELYKRLHCILCRSDGAD